MNIFQQLVQVIMLRRRPQDLSFDQTAAVFYAVLHTGLSFIAMAQAKVYTQPLAIAVIQSVAQAGLLYLFLKTARLETRFIQTCTAIFGVSAILTALVWLLTQIPLLGGFGLMLIVWNFYLSVLILRDSFDSGLIRAIFLAIALGLAAVFLTSLLIPEYITQTQAIFDVEQAAQSQK